MYDARGSSSGGNGNLLFAIVTIVVVGLAFLFAWFGGGLFSGGSSDTPAIANAALPQDSTVSTELNSDEEQRFLLALNTLDPSTYSQLESEFASATSQDDRLKTVGIAAGRAIMANAEHLAHISSNDINQLLDMALRDVSAARRADHQLCKGSSYIDMDPNMSQVQTERWLERHGLGFNDVYMSSVGWQADILEMINRAKRSPSHHGQLNRQDEAAFQGLAMSLMSDPAIMQLMMSQGNDRSAMRNLDVCFVAESLLREVRALPDGTKTRAWAAAFDSPEFRQGLREARRAGF